MIHPGRGPGDDDGFAPRALSGVRRGGQQARQKECGHSPCKLSHLALRKDGATVGMLLPGRGAGQRLTRQRMSTSEVQTVGGLPHRGGVCLGRSGRAHVPLPGDLASVIPHDAVGHHVAARMPWPWARVASDVLPTRRASTGHRSAPPRRGGSRSHPASVQDFTTRRQFRAHQTPNGCRLSRR